MTELILKPLYKGYILTDFNGHDIGIRDTEQAIEEIRRLLKESERNNGQLTTDNESHFTQSIQQNNDNDSQIEKTKNNEVSIRPNYTELHRKIFEKAKEQIDLVGKINGAKIARELGANNSTVHSHIKKMSAELDELIKKYHGDTDVALINNDAKAPSDENIIQNGGSI